MREQLIAQVGTLEAGAPPRLARCAAEREPVVAARQLQRVPAPRPHLLRGALETEDGKAAVAVTAQGQIGLAQTILQLPAARERERALRLLLVGQPRDIGQRVLLRHRAQRLRTSAELAEEEALVHALCRRGAHTQRQLLDHAETALRAHEQLAQAWARRGRRQRRQVDVRGGRRQAQAEQHAGDRAVARGGLPRRTRRRAAAE